METAHSCHSMLCSHDTGCASFYQARVESNTSSENHKTCFTQKHFSSCDLRFSFLLVTEINLAFALSRRRSSFPPLVDKPFSTSETLCLLVFVDCGELFADDASRWGDLRHRSTYKESHHIHACISTGLFTAVYSSSHRRGT